MIESDHRGRGCFGQKSIGQSDSDCAAHKKTGRCAYASETRALARNECSANKSDARDNLAGAGVMRRVLSQERAERGGGPQWFKNDRLEMRGRYYLSSYAYKRPNRFAMKSSQVTSSMRTSPWAGVFPCAKRSTSAVIPAAVVN